MVDSLLNEKTVWEFLKECNLPIVLYGMGNGADKIIEQLDKIGLNPSEVMASDDFVRGQFYRGYKVKKLSEIEEEYSDFVILICFASQLPDVMENIKRIAKKHLTLIPCVPVFGDLICDHSFIERYKDNINKAYKLFEDDLSKKVFINTLKLYYTGKLEFLLDNYSDKDEVFNNIVLLGDNENYLDLGAYRGDTIDEFLNYSGKNYSSITALDPDAKTFKKLKLYAENLENTRLYQYGIWNKPDVLMFENNGGRNSFINKNTNKNKCVEIQVTSIDTIMSDLEVSYIKMDVEGAEFEAINGGIQTIKKYSPKMNIAVYHHCEDMFMLPLLINEINPEYKFYLRQHPYIPAWDLNLYCVKR